MAAELAEIEDVSVLAGELAQLVIEPVERVHGVQEGGHLAVHLAVVVSGR
jgi:hypothetical protein